MEAKINYRNLLLLLLTVSIVAGVLTLVNLPEWLFYFRPDWLALLVVYWVMILPERLSLTYACLNGLFLDVLSIKPFGLNAIGFVLLAYFVASWSTQIRALSLWQQSLFVAVLILLMKLVVGGIAILTTDFVFTFNYFFSTISNMVFWLVIVILFRDPFRLLQKNQSV